MGKPLSLWLRDIGVRAIVVETFSMLRLEVGRSFSCWVDEPVSLTSDVRDLNGITLGSHGHRNLESLQQLTSLARRGMAVAGPDSLSQWDIVVFVVQDGERR